MPIDEAEAHRHGLIMNPRNAHVLFANQAAEYEVPLPIRRDGEDYDDIV